MNHFRALLFIPTGVQVLGWNSSFNIFCLEKTSKQNNLLILKITIVKLKLQWNTASDDLYCPYAENDLRENGKFKSTMSSRDGKTSFDFEGVYTLVKNQEAIHYRLTDGREVQISFTAVGKTTIVTITFEAENVNSVELQRNGWQAI